MDRGRRRPQLALLSWSNRSVDTYDRVADTSNAFGDFAHPQVLGEAMPGERAPAATLLDCFDHPPLRNEASLASRRRAKRNAALTGHLRRNPPHCDHPSLWVEPFSLLSGSTVNPSLMAHLSCPVRVPTSYFDACLLLPFTSIASTVCVQFTCSLPYLFLTSHLQRAVLSRCLMGPTQHIPGPAAEPCSNPRCGPSWHRCNLRPVQLSHLCVL